MCVQKNVKNAGQGSGTLGTHSMIDGTAAHRYDEGDLGLFIKITK